MINKLLSAILILLLSSSILANIKNAIKVNVNDIVCMACVKKITKKFSAKKEIKKVDINLKEKLVTLEFKPDQQMSKKRITALLNIMGYKDIVFQKN